MFSQAQVAPGTTAAGYLLFECPEDLDDVTRLELRLTPRDGRAAPLTLFILIGLGAGDLKLEVALLDGASGVTVERFSTDGAIVAGGVMGASMGIDDMIASAAGKVSDRVVTYGVASGH
jgi:hypothetical protein